MLDEHPSSNINGILFQIKIYTKDTSYYINITSQFQF